MKTRWLRIVGVAASLGMVAAFALPQEGLGKKKKGGGSSSGGSSGGGGSKPRSEPPPRRSNGGGGQSGGSGRSGGSGNPGGMSSGGGSIFGRRGGDENRGNSGLGRRRGTTRTPSRSGTVRYGTMSNLGNRVRRDDGRIGRAPQRFDPGLIRRVNRQERVGLAIGNHRVGYVHYNRGWRDDNFCYPHYVFDPYSFYYDYSYRYGSTYGVNVNYGIYYSPWYYYPSLPGYIHPTRVTIVNNYTTPSWEGFDYRWNRPDRNDRERRYEDIDYVLADLVEAFEEGDRRAASKLVPRDGQVSIYIDGRYAYSVGPDDFYDLLMDGVESTRTRRYEIVSVRSNGRDAARVVARHDYEDPWGRTTSVTHRFLLEREGRDIVIREFEVRGE